MPCARPPNGPTVQIMAAGSGHRVGQDQGKLILRTFREGLAAQAGHDLTIEITRWSGSVVVAEDIADSSVEVAAEMGTLRVLAGTGGVRPLSDRDKREIATTARRLLDADHRPTATFTSEKVGGAAERGVVAGRLTISGVERPLELSVTALGNGRYRATGTVRQSEFGITPYTAFFGALRLADAVDIEAEVDISEKKT